MIVVDILLLYSPVDSDRPSTNDGTRIRGRSKRPRHDVASQGTPSSSAGISVNRDGLSNSASSGVNTGSIITGLTGSTTPAAAVSGTNAIAGTITGSMNMLTVKEAKKPE